MTVVSHRTNVVIPATPPTHFYPDSNGDAIPAGGLNWSIAIDSTGYTPGSTADFTVQYQYSGIWQDDASVGGFILGSYTNLHGVTTSVNTLSSSINSTANPYPDRGRVRIDAFPAGTLASVTLSIS